MRTNQILSWQPSIFDILANNRNSPDIINARKRISGYWSHNRFFKYNYEPSSEYKKHIKKHTSKKSTKKFKLCQNLLQEDGYNV